MTDHPVDLEAWDKLWNEIIEPRTRESVRIVNRQMLVNAYPALADELRALRANAEIWRKMWNDSDAGRAEDTIRHRAEIATLRADLDKARTDLEDMQGNLRAQIERLEGER